MPLVEQQASVIRSNCTAEVLELSGASNAKKLEKGFWDEVYMRADAVVCTAQILLDLLRAGFVQMKRVGINELLICLSLPPSWVCTLSNKLLFPHWPG